MVTSEPWNRPKYYDYIGIIDRNSGHALMNDRVLKCLFSCFCHKDLKSCRLVCSKWMELSKPRLVRSSILSFSNLDQKYSIESRDCQYCKEVFHDLTKFPFKKVRFEGDFIENEVKNFFSTYYKLFEDLTLRNFNLLNFEGVLIETFDISEWKGLRLRALRVQSGLVDFKVFTELIIPLNFLGNIERLFLVKATVVLNCKIAAENVHIMQGRCHRKGAYVCYPTILNINDYFEEGRLRVLKLSNAFNLKSRFDVSRCNDLQDLYVRGVLVVGWHHDLRIEKLNIGFDPMFDVYQMPRSVVIFNEDERGTIGFEEPPAEKKGFEEKWLEAFGPPNQEEKALLVQTRREGDESDH